uniref:peptide-methionine (S)-S-oxide reductase n=1 Tax=Pseudictyota dubia TaxID=2749911 RepID=A0A7R9Z4T8_9STRA|mmetsp:Transcript_22607/g.42094  ORF Transcript_22607/g.42094 Transcript_22607/m.42094 type:complete len:101 (+) Transcript_22607:249-551(+)
MKDYTECVLVEFDPKVVTFEELLVDFGRMHTPTASSRQYRSVIFYSNQEQQEQAEEFLEGLRGTYRGVREVATKIEPMTRFYKAEEYHQHYIAKRQGNSY